MIYSKDYDLYKRQAIGVIDEKEKENRLRNKKVCFESIYNNRRLDTIIINNVLPDSQKLILSVLQNDSVSIFKGAYESFTENYSRVAYYVFSKKRAISYTFNLHEVMFGDIINCDINVIKSDYCVGGMKFLKQSDTTNFVNKLLAEKDIPIDSSLHAIEYSNRLNNKFTFLKWFNLKDGKVIH